MAFGGGASEIWHDSVMEGADWMYYDKDEL